MGCTPSNPGMMTPCPTCPPGEPGRGIDRLEPVPGTPGVYNVIGTDGAFLSTVTFPPGPTPDPGTDGVGIDRVEQGANGVVTVYGTNGAVLGTFLPPKGDTGDDGLSFTSAVVDSEGHLILIRSDGERIDAGLIPKPTVSLTSTDEGLQLCVGSGCDKECSVLPWAEICAKLASNGCVLAPAPDCTLPSIISPAPQSWVVGTPVNVQITILNATSVVTSGLPTGVTAATAVDGVNVVVTITGTPTAPGTTTVMFAAANTGPSCGPVSANLTGPVTTVTQAPALVSAPVIETTETEGGTISVTTPPVFSGSPAPTLTCVWFLNGVEQPTATACTQLTNAAPGSWELHVSASNGTGAPATTVSNACVVAANPVACPTPSVTATLSPLAFQVGVAYTGAIEVANATGAGVLGLPAGVTAGALSGTTIPVSGTPTTEGAFNVTVDLVNACGTGTTTNANGVAAGSGSVAPAAALPCPTPSVTSTLTPTTFQVGVAYSGAIEVANATAVTVLGLPAGVTAGALSGTTVPVSGTPTTEGAFNVTADLVNACGTGTTTSVNGAAAGSGTVLPAAVLPCPTPTVTQELTATALDVWGGTNCCDITETAQAYTPGTTVGFTTGPSGPFQASASGTEVTQFVKSVFGFNELPGSCGHRTILFLTAANEVTGWSMFETAGAVVDCV